MADKIKTDEKIQNEDNTVSEIKDEDLEQATGGVKPQKIWFNIEESEQKSTAKVKSFI